MAKSCSVCDSPKRATLEAAVASGQTRAAAAEALGMAYESVKRHFRYHVGVARSVATPASPVAPATESAVDTFRAAYLVDPMAHQVAYLDETRDLMVLKGRQVGMSTAAAALAAHVVRGRENVLVAIVSPSMKQSQEVTVKCRTALVNLGEPLVKDSAGVLQLENRSRILSLAGTARAVRGWSADLLIIDEAAFVAAETFAAARATTIATGGRTIVQSTPGNPVGAFYEMWSAELPAWARIHVRSDEASTISAADLARFKSEMSPEAFAQEYEAEFASAAMFRPGWFPADEFDDRVDPRFEAIKIPPLGG